MYVCIGTTVKLLYHYLELQCDLEVTEVKLPRHYLELHFDHEVTDLSYGNNVLDQRGKTAYDDSLMH